MFVLKSKTTRVSRSLIGMQAAQGPARESGAELRAALQEGALRPFSGRSGSVSAANRRDRGHRVDGQEVDEDRVT